jgi:uncharacterized membrane protein YhaH (DUF805 family)
MTGMDGKTMRLLSLLFSFYGKINRKQFWLLMLLYITATIVATAVGVFAVLAAKSGVTQQEAAEAFRTVFLAWSGLTLIPLLSLYTKRLHDRRKSGWWLLLLLLPCTMLAIIWPALAAGGIVSPNSNAWFLIPLAPFFGWLAPIGLIPLFNDIVGIKLLVKLGAALLSLINLWLLVELCFLKGRQAPNEYGVDPLPATP